MTDCPCGSGLAMSQCCGPYLEGLRQAPTAEVLMRARYTAHVLRDTAFIDKSTHPGKRLELAGDADGVDGVQWTGLTVLRVEGGGANDAKGEVEFEARFRVNGVDSRLHEISQFVREDGTWFYVDGNLVEDKPRTRHRKKIGRNEPCPCGSGKKYKKCCGM